MPKLTVQLVTWNGAKYLPYLFACLRAQTCRDWSLLVLDNGSTDGTPDIITRELEQLPMPAAFMRNPENSGFAGGHNTLYARVNTPYLQLLNQDVILAPEYFERVLAYMEEHPQCAAAQGMLCRWDFSRAETANRGRTDVIDTLGLKVFRSRRVIDWMTGTEISDFRFQISDDPIGVFGVSGALPMYRRAAIVDVADDGELFDPDFFAYKEDVDLAFRLRLAGWNAALVPEARAWHDRTAAGLSDLSDAAAVNDRRSKSAFVRYHSYKNHLFVLMKNEPWATFWRDAPAILWYEVKKFVYLLFREPGTLRALGEVVHRLPSMARKRRVIMGKMSISLKEMRRWFI